MTKIQSPNRYDVVGSFLRPAALKQARADFENGAIDRAQLTAVEDDAVRNLVAKEKAAGLRVLTDGEFRRATWHLDFMWAFDGIGHSRTETGLPFHDEQAMIDDTYLTGKLGLSKPHPFIDHFKFVHALEDDDTVAKLTIPAPAQFIEGLVMPFAAKNTAKYYSDNDELASDLVEAYVAFIDELYAAGCRNLQFDDCSWGMLCDERAPEFFGCDQAGVDAYKEQFLAINNAVLDRLPSDLTINTHVCRGNFHSTYANAGAYDAVASTLLAREHVHAFFLEFDDERSGGFEPLAQVPDDKLVVLGLVTTKRAQLEDPDAIVARINDAARYVPLERLCVSPQCGFASCEIGNKLNEDEQWAKVALVREVAERVWK